MTLAFDLAPGFQEPVHGAQQTFRAVLEALANPARIVPLAGLAAPPEGLNGTLAVVALTLLDHETCAYLSPAISSEPVRRYVAFHTGAPVVSEAAEADFVLLRSGDGLPNIGTLKAGTAEYPDRSATVLIGIEDFEAGGRVLLAGPGIEKEIGFSASGIGAEFWTAARRNHARFPLGVDFIFCGPDAIAGLPRSTSIAV